MTDLYKAAKIVPREHSPHDRLGLWSHAVDAKF